MSYKRFNKWADRLEAYSAHGHVVGMGNARDKYIASCEGYYFAHHGFGRHSALYTVLPRIRA